MKKNKILIILLILVLLLGWFLGWISNKNSWIAYSAEIKFGVWEIIYYIAAVITAFGTLGAVFVALFKDKIIRLFSRPDLVLEMNDDNCFCEDVDSEQQNPSSSKYQSLLNITNKGNVVAPGCEVYIASVRYKKVKKRISKTLLIPNQSIG